jgi:hypothetical protein
MLRDALHTQSDKMQTQSHDAAGNSLQKPNSSAFGLPFTGLSLHILAAIEPPSFRLLAWL